MSCHSDYTGLMSGELPLKQQEPCLAARRTLLIRWDEVDLEATVWTVPGHRMKAKVIHCVPLSCRAVEILRAQRQRHLDSELVFPAPRGGVLSDMVLTKFLRDQNACSGEKGRLATAHGFRSSFRDWASENGYARDSAERVLAHTIQNQAEAAYHRTDLLEQRRAMMQAWAQYISSGAPAGESAEATSVEPSSNRCDTTTHGMMTHKMVNTPSLWFG